MTTGRAQPLVETIERGVQLIAPLPSEDEDLGRTRHQADVQARVILPPVFLQRDVEIGAAEAEGADAGPPRLGAGGDPGTRFGVEVERRPVEIDARARPVHANRRRQNLVLQSQDGLDEAGETGHGLGVADHRLDRAHGHGGTGGTPVARAALAAKDLAQGGQLGGIADGGAGAVGLDQRHGGRREAGVLVGALEGPHLSGGERGRQAAVLAVAGCANALDDRVDPIAVALGVGQALEDDAGNALAQGNAVRRVVEGTRPSARRQGVRFGEAHVTERIVGDVHAAGNHQVSRARAQMLDSGIHPRQGGGTGRIHNIGGSVEVQLVSDAPGDDVGQNARKAVLGPLRQQILQGRAQRLALGGQLRAQLCGVVTQHGAQAVGDGQVVRAGGGEEDSGAVAREMAAIITGVTHGLDGHFQREQLVRLDARQAGGRNVPFDRVEDAGIKEAAPA
jgi:hypothetical protein